jgi:hypothetical protein
MSRPPSDIVIVVPRWAVIATGLVLLLIELTFAFVIIFAGFIQEGGAIAFISLALSPLQILIIYIVWRYFWVLLPLTSFLSAVILFSSNIISGRNEVYLGRNASGVARITIQQFSINLLVAFIVAMVIVIMIASIIQAFIPVRSSPDTVSPRRKSRRGNGLPHPHDPYWDDE